MKPFQQIFINFVGYSVLCRLALNDNVIDAASFTSIRLFSGIIFLLFLVAVKNKKRINIKEGNWLSASFLFLYATAFSYAYVSLDTGIGALILFGLVQVTMIVSGLLNGKKLLFIEWVGLFVALLILLTFNTLQISTQGIVLAVISGTVTSILT